MSKPPKLYDSFVRAILDGDMSVRIPSLEPDELQRLRTLPFEEAKKRLEETLFAEEDGDE